MKTELKKIVLVELPFWTPMIPPMGIAVIKGYLSQKGYSVKTLDANTDNDFKLIYGNYFNILKEYVPLEERGNFYSIGTDVLRNHLMAYLNKRNQEEHFEVLKLIIESIYFIKVEKSLLYKLEKTIEDFYNWLTQYISDTIEIEKPEVFGITVLKDTLPASLFAFQLVKKINSNIITIMGGTIFSEQLSLGSPDFDFFVEKTSKYIDKYFIGYGVKNLEKFLKGELDESKNVYVGDFEESKIYFEPDLSDFSIEKYPYLGLEGSSGCYYNCSFCNVTRYFGDFQQKDINNVIGTMRKYFEQYNNQMFFMGDNMINSYINDFSTRIIEQKLPVYWSAYARMHNDCLDFDKVKLWRKGGLYQVRIGVDSGSEKMIELMDKKFSIEKSKIALKNLAKAGIKVTAYFVVGHPDETEDDFQSTLSYITEMKDYVWEAECEYYNYYVSGQGGSDIYAERRKLLYPTKYKDLLMVDKWIVDGQPTWDEIFSRNRRFINHCRNLGIPNAYTLSDIVQADRRWKKLHSNSVPPLYDFISRNKTVIDSERFNSNKTNKRIKIEDFDF